MPTVLIIGAAGQVGSATLQASLSRSYPTIAFLRTPSKLPRSLASDINCRIVVGDAQDKSAVLEAIKNDSPNQRQSTTPDRDQSLSTGNTASPVDAVIVTAPFGDMRGRRSGYEIIARNVIDSINEIQQNHLKDGKKIKLWLMAGSAVLEHPEKRGRFLASLMPFTFYPEYPIILEYLAENGKDIHWTMNCPALIKKGEPSGPLVESITTLPLYQPPYSTTLANVIPFNLGWAVNTMYNWVTGAVTFKSLGEYMIDNLGHDERLRGKRVGVLETPAGKSK